MNYFNGFALKNEEDFFKSYTVESDFCVAGFSYGAQKALEYALNSTERIDRLILLSPAFFQHQKSSFRRTQLLYFKADQKAYTTQFLNNVAYPSNINLETYLSTGSHNDLDALLSYIWDKDKILELLNRGVRIEIFMGEEDKIVDSEKSFEFFSEVATVYLLKGVGHLLQPSHQ